MDSFKIIPYHAEHGDQIIASGMNNKLMLQYIEYVADRLLLMLGLEKLPNP